MKIEKILLPVDFSRGAGLAVSTGIELAKTNRSALVLIYVAANPLAHQPIPEHLAGLVGPLQESLSKFKDIYLQRMKKQYGPMAGNVEIEYIVSDGSPATEIVTQAERLGANLIIMPLVGSSLFKKLILGSTTDQVLRAAPCPVLVLPPPAVGLP